MATSKITVNPVIVRGKLMYQVRRWENGKPKRTFFSTKNAADIEANDLREQVSELGKTWLALSSSERQEVIHLFKAMKERKLSTALVIALMDKNPSVANSPSLQAVIDELVAAKEKAGNDSKYTTNLGYVLNAFAEGKGSVRMSEVTFADVEAHLDKHSLAYRSTLRGRLSGLFAFAIRRQYRTDNPCARLETVKYLKPKPPVFTTEQFQMAVKWMLTRKRYRKLLGWFALSTLCGLRPEEAEQTDPDRDINFKEKFVKVEAQTSKVRQRRVIYPLPEALKFLKWSMDNGGQIPLARSERRQIIWKLRAELAFAKWPKDITRHTAASYWLARGETKGRVADMLGNSEKVLKRDYDARMTRKEAEELRKVILGFVKA